MPTLWNLDHQPVVLNWTDPAIMPGEPHDFTDEQIAAGLTGLWSETDPREGLGAEQVFKLARDSTRQDLDEQAAQLGIDPAELATKQEVAEAIQAALAARAQTIDADNPSPAESGDKE